MSQGVFVVVEGTDGAGKSSVMKTIAGVLQYEGGSAEVFGTVLDSEHSTPKTSAKASLPP